MKLKKVLGWILHPLVLIPANLLAMLILAIPSPSPLVEAMVWITGGLGLLALLQALVNITVLNKNARLTNFGYCVTMAMPAVCFAALSTYPVPGPVSQTGYLWLSMAAFALTLVESLSRGMFMLNIALNGTDGYARQTLERILAQQSCRWGQSINMKVNRSIGRSIPHDRYVNSLLNQANKALPFL